jgi:hypothetical protein
MTWKKGDKAICHCRNAPGIEVPVPAVVLEATGKLVTILALPGDERSKRNVNPDRLSPRTQHFEAMDDNK